MKIRKEELAGIVSGVEGDPYNVGRVTDPAFLEGPGSVPNFPLSEDVFTFLIPPRIEIRKEAKN